MDEKTDWLKVRIANLTAAVAASKATPNWAASDDELREVGRITLLFARVEETIAAYCEVLLLRPELRGFHSAKPTLERTLTEKLDLYKRLVLAIGCLHSIDTAQIEKNIIRMKEIGERRNAVIHGQLYSNEAGEIVFRTRRNEVRADLAALVPLTTALLEFRIDYAEAFNAFYGRLPRSGPPYPTGAEEKLLIALDAQVVFYKSSLNVHRSAAVLSDRNADLAAAKKVLRNSERRMSRALARRQAASSRLPKEYQNLLRQWDRQFRRCKVVASRPNHDRQAETAKLERLTERIKAYEEREHVAVSDSVRQTLAADIASFQKLRRE